MLALAVQSIVSSVEHVGQLTCLRDAAIQSNKLYRTHVHKKSPSKEVALSTESISQSHDMSGTSSTDRFVVSPAKTEQWIPGQNRDAGRGGKEVGYGACGVELKIHHSLNPLLFIDCREGNRKVHIVTGFNVNNNYWLIKRNTLSNRNILNDREDNEMRGGIISFADYEKGRRRV
ncbi:hypothetical protein Bca4012_098610 [Brassica carinata]